MRENLIKLLIAAWATVLLASCTTGPRPTPAGDSLDNRQLQQQVDQLIENARQAPAPERPQYLIRASQLLLAQEQADWALNLLGSIDPDNLGDYTYLDYTDTFSGAALASGRYFKAREALFDNRLEALWASVDKPRQKRLLERRAKVESLLGDYRESLYARLKLNDYFSDAPSRQLNNEAIWQDLMSLPQAQLESLASPQEAAAQDKDLQGWAQLALISRNNAANLERQLERVQAWQTQWPEHPASVELPSDLQLLRQLIKQQPRSIALLLPQTGRLSSAAAAVRDGFLAAYFNQGADELRPEIRQYDTSGQDIMAVYERALAEGAQLIVGPLAKEHVETLAQRADLAVPVLALNYRETDAGQPIDTDPLANLTNMASEGLSQNNSLFSPELYQFGLAPEDEARQIAHHAHLQGHRRALVIAPDIDWAERSVRAFARQWDELGGEILADRRYIGAGDYSELIQQALLIDDSQERHRELRRIIYTNMEFEPRRRRDIDVIFLIANPREARQIKPTLAFHYAGDIPVLATSQVYNGEQDTKGNRDLNGVRFATLPWLFSSSPEARAIERYSDAPATYKRLHAMGVDAYHLYPRLPQLQRLPQTRLIGSTGTLSMNEAGRIRRETAWAEFIGGEARPIATSNIERATPR